MGKNRRQLSKVGFVILYCEALVNLQRAILKLLIFLKLYPDHSKKIDSP